MIYRSCAGGTWRSNGTVYKGILGVESSKFVMLYIIPPMLVYRYTSLSACTEPPSLGGSLKCFLAS